MSRFASLYPSSQRSKSQYRPPLPGPRSFRPPFVGQHHPPGVYQPRTPLRSRPPAPFLPRSSGTNYPRPRDPLGRKGSSYLQNQPQEYNTDEAYANPYNREYFQANPNQQTEPFNQESWETEQTVYSEFEDQETVNTETEYSDVTYNNSGSVSTGIDGHVTPIAFRRGRGFARGQSHANRGRDFQTRHASAFEKQKQTEYLDDETIEPYTLSGHGQGLLQKPSRGLPERGRGYYSPGNRGRADNRLPLSSSTNENKHVEEPMTKQTSLLSKDETESSSATQELDPQDFKTKTSVQHAAEPKNFSVQTSVSETSGLPGLCTETFVSNNTKPATSEQSTQKLENLSFKTDQSKTPLSQPTFLSSPSFLKSLQSSSETSVVTSSAVVSSTSQNNSVSGPSVLPSLGSISSEAPVTSSAHNTVQLSITATTATASSTANKAITTESQALVAGSDKLIASFAQSLLSSVNSEESIIRKPKYMLPPFHPNSPLLSTLSCNLQIASSSPQYIPTSSPQYVPTSSPQYDKSDGPQPQTSIGSQSPILQRSPHQTPPFGSQNVHSSPGPQKIQSPVMQAFKSSPGPQTVQSPLKHGFQPSSVSEKNQSSVSQGQLDSSLSQYKVKEETQEEAEEEDSDEEIDTGYCQYCNINFNNPDSYWKHTRGLLHTQKLMDFERKKKDEGEEFFKTEIVDAGPKYERRDQQGKKILSTGERQQLAEENKKSIQERLKMVMNSSGEAADSGDYDFNKANWMDVEVEQKPKIPAWEKDLNPNDVGKEQFPDEFYCEVCDVRCTGSVTFKMHVEGNKHKTKVDKGNLQNMVTDIIYRTNMELCWKKILKKKVFISIKLI
ncbi:uncharacterized protein LOC127730586 isoform X2 [Mytilus californianus]|uniref:uncharacterized protein LOC127730586 isoform X2 n=1 Tax=Mytilus californianus TaxID=6549 RepID=UPI002245A377|nr:uncharacterized protein LOC127730586 isoform X2 [Mytilus californianus]